MSDSLPLVLVTHRFDPFLKAKLSQLDGARFQYVTSLFADLEKLKQAEALIARTSTPIDADFLKKAPHLKFIVSATSGFDHIDLEATAKQGVRVFHTPEAQTVAAAELTLLFIFACSRKWSLAAKQIKKGDWQRSLLLGQQVSGLSLGLIGLGRVGQAVAARAKALGLKVQAYDPYLEEPPRDVTMLGYEELMRSSDIVSVHVPKTPTTRHMIKKETLQWMDPQATLINMSRGDVVNEADLIEHLQKYPEFSAGLDVFAKEPLVTKSPLLELSNVCLSPHIGASTEQALRLSSQQAVDKVLALFRGEKPGGELPPRALWYEEG